MAGFLVPFIAGGIAQSLATRDEYDENAGNFVDAASTKYNAQFDLNQKAIELQNANYKAVSGSLGLSMAEIAAKDGNLNDVPTNQVIAFVKEKYSKAFIDKVDKRSKEEGFTLKDLGYQTLFSQDYATATKELKENRDWAASNLNKGAVKHLTDLYLAKGEELPEPTGLEKAQKFMFGDRVTEGTGVGFEQAVAEKLGDEITVQPKEFKATGTVEERLDFTEPVNMGTVAEQDKAIANILNIEDIRIAEGGGILFPVRFRNEALAIKETARKYALEFTTMKGGTEVVNVSGLMQKAHDDLAENIITPIADRFRGYKVDTTSNFAKSMSFRVMQTSGMNTTSTWYTDNNFTEKDFVSGEKTDFKGDEGINTILVSAKVAEAMEQEIANLDSMANQKLYVDYLPDNLRIETVDGPVPLKAYYKNIFALASY
jgi:hypothetical protein